MKTNWQRVDVQRVFWSSSKNIYYKWPFMSLVQSIDILNEEKSFWSLWKLGISPLNLPRVRWDIHYFSLLFLSLSSFLFFPLNITFSLPSSPLFSSVAAENYYLSLVFHLFVLYFLHPSSLYTLTFFLTSFLIFSTWFFYATENFPVT